MADGMSEHPETTNESVSSVHTPDATRHDFTPPLPAETSDHHKLPRLPTPHVEKFRAALAVLGVVAVTAIAIAIVAISGHTSKSRAATASSWSVWAPSTGGSSGIQQIADYIAPFYRFSTAQQLDVITPISLTSATSAGTTTGKGLTIAVNSGGSSTSESLSLLTGSTAAYNVCGIGASDCELAGTASTSRMLLLRREALELALYTFKYLSTVSNVLVVLPPGHTTSKIGVGVTAAKPVTVSVLFERAELKLLLTSPIDEALAADPPQLSQLATWSKSDEAGLVDEATARGLFSEQVEAQQEGGNLMVLSPLSPQ